MIRPKKLNGITISVRNLERSMAWYKEKFGFEKLFDDAPNSKGVVIGGGGVELCLQQVDNPQQARTVDHPRQVCVRLIGFEVTEADLARVAAEFPEDRDIVVMDDHPKYRSRIVEDPDGHCIELYAPRR
jgi:catechol-2,3-dioxygenase